MLSSARVKAYALFIILPSLIAFTAAKNSTASDVRGGIGMQEIADGSFTSPRGFSAASSACGLKKSGAPDLVLLLADRKCSCAGVFTRNQVAAAPVILDRETLASNSTRLRGVVANAGIANACTGPAGLEAARGTQRMAAEALNCNPDQVLVLSTGLIGVQLDLDKIESGIRQAASELSPDNGPAAARAIMTTDSVPKHSAVIVQLPQGDVIIGGIAKGSGMIHPDMATMLSVLTTDAAIAPQLLTELLSEVVDGSFNRISVDGDTSTNDTVLLLANGARDVSVDDAASRAAFKEGLEWICLHLAHSIVRDGEGASKFVTLQITGARQESEALKVARSIATSALVKTALAGSDPNWGRILAAAGRAARVLKCSCCRMVVLFPTVKPKLMRCSKRPKSLFGLTWGWERIAPPSGPAI